ncbi:MAG: bifunctional phosphopantothenoylcysteine decarboxylase/phosphopantothenate--cysteine ligase CoaBC [bacterium]|jgi:phosphopantothenoylcysteine decarboxylase/phosphopantothenate--cysteine ligase
MGVILGIGGGIAAYKAAELARALMKRGLVVQAVMTPAAQEFIKPLTFTALTSRRTLTEMFVEEEAIEHIRIAQENEALVVAPATADLMARFAAGIANDLLTTLYLAFTGPVVLAPAMNVNMLRHAATQKNLETLRARGHVIVEPAEGTLACGMVGPGRLADPECIAEAVLAVLQPKRDLEGETVLVTAGPTQEALDPVRFLSNRSSGKMGYAIAEAAARRGARVVLVSGPVSLPEPIGVRVVRVTTAAEMRAAVLAELEAASIVVKAAAVADYRPREVADHKIKKSGAAMTLELEATPDILAEIGSRKGSRLVVGFAAETGDPESEARRKLEAKNCDMVVGNLIGTAFASDENEVVLVTRAGATRLPRMSKREVADRIFDHLLALR